MMIHEIIGYSFVALMGLFAICSFLIANEIDTENESISNHTEKEIKHGRNLEKL